MLIVVIAGIVCVVVILWFQGILGIVGIVKTIDYTEMMLIMVNLWSLVRNSHLSTPPTNLFSC